MAQHKAPTAVTVAPIQEKSGLGLWISTHWIHISIVVLAIAGFIVFRYQQEQGRLESQASSWEKLTGPLERDPATGLVQGDPTALAALATDLKDTIAGPSARIAEVESRIRRHDYDGAASALEALTRDHPTHPYVVAQLQVGDASMTLVESLRRSIDEMRAFDAAHPGMYANPEPAPDAPRVRLVTDQGEIVVALYPQHAPKHCENFLKLCDSGFYAGTKFHRVMPKYMILGGDPNSKTGDPSTWGLGGPDQKIEPEQNDICHFPGTLVMFKGGADSQSNGSQFYITTNEVHALNGMNTAFGTVVQGMEVVKKIAAVPPAPNSDRPLTPVVLVSTEVIKQ